MNDYNTLVIISLATFTTAISITVGIYMFFLNSDLQTVFNQKSKDIFMEKELAKAKIEIKEQSYNYVRKELQDDIAQKLSVAKMMSGQMLSTFDNSDNFKILENINLLLGECIQDIRNVSKTFTGNHILNFGLIDLIEKEIERICKLNLAKIKFGTNQNKIDIDYRHSVILFRMLQEFINNNLNLDNEILIEINSSEENLLICAEICSEYKSDISKLQESLNNRSKLINADFKIKSKTNNNYMMVINYKKQIDGYN